MTATAVLAHGGVAGAALEFGFIVVPLIIFTVLSRISRRRREQEEGASDDEVA